MVNWEKCKYLCPYCGCVAALVGGDVVYPHRPDLAELQLYYCKKCKAWVGCHKGTIEPFGRLANAELRRLKQQAHEAFDLLWKPTKLMPGEPEIKLVSRAKAYKMLSDHMDKDKHITHIGWFDEAECKEVVRWALDAIQMLRLEKHMDIGTQYQCTCGEWCDPASSQWRWGGEVWEHSHGHPVGHCVAIKRTKKQRDQARKDALPT